MAKTQLANGGKRTPKRKGASKLTGATIAADRLRDDSHEDGETPDERYDRVYSDVLDIIRKARILYALDAMTKARQQQATTSILNFFFLPRTSQAVRDAVETMHSDLDATDDQPKICLFVKRFGSLMLCLCAHSKTFREQLERGPEDDNDENEVLWWDHVLELISQQAYGLELFGRLRSLDWMKAIRYHDAMFQTLICDVLTRELGEHTATGTTSWRKARFFTRWTSVKTIGKRHQLPADQLLTREWALIGKSGSARCCELEYDTTIKGRTSTMTLPQEILAESRIAYCHKWPLRAKWPQDDPRYCTSESVDCAACDGGHAENASDLCDCNFEDLKNAKKPLLELFEGPLGTSVRALQTIQKSQYLYEYTGVMYPFEKVNSNAAQTVAPKYGGQQGVCYRLVQDLAPRNVISRGRGDDRTSERRHSPSEFKTFVVDPAVHGNWTRYLNHSCDSLTSFQRVVVGQKELLLVQARKEIEFGDELTVDYGNVYFNDKSYPCKCGKDKCKKWDVDDKNTKMTLGQARRTGVAPAWATDGTAGIGTSTTATLSGTGVAITAAAPKRQQPRRNRLPRR